MGEIDKDGDGTISRSEFRAWTSARIKSREHNETMEILFQVQCIVLNLANDARNVSASASTEVMEVRVEGIQINLRQSSSQLKMGLIVRGLNVQDLASKYAASRYLVNTTNNKRAAHTVTTTTTRITDAGASSSSSSSSALTVASSSSSAAPSDVTFLQGDEFINFSVVTTSDRAASFALRPVEVDVRIGFSTVLLCLEPDSLKRIGMYVWTVFVMPEETHPASSPPQARGNAVSVVASPQPAKPRAAAAPGSSAAVSSPPAAAVAATKQKRDVRSSIAFAMHFQSLKVQMYSKNEPLAEAVVDRSVAGFFA